MTLAQRWCPLFPRVGLQGETRLQHCSEEGCRPHLTPALPAELGSCLRELLTIRGGAPLLAPRLQVIHTLFTKLFSSTSKNHSQFSYKIQRQMAIPCPGVLILTPAFMPELLKPSFQPCLFLLDPRHPQPYPAAGRCRPLAPLNKLPEAHFELFSLWQNHLNLTKHSRGGQISPPRAWVSPQGCVSHQEL